MKILYIFLIIALLNAASLAKKKYISIQKANLLSQANLLSKVITTLPYGSEVDVSEKKGSYYLTKYGQLTGFIHQSAMIDTKIDLSVRTQSQASATEIAAATKGFNQQVEARYKKENPKLRFDLVDIAEENDKIDDFENTGKFFRQQGSLGEYKKGGK